MLSVASFDVDVRGRFGGCSDAGELDLELDRRELSSRCSSSSSENGEFGKTFDRRSPQGIDRVALNLCL